MVNMFKKIKKVENHMPCGNGENVFWGELAEEKGFFAVRSTEDVYRSTQVTIGNPYNTMEEAKEAAMALRD